MLAEGLLRHETHENMKFMGSVKGVKSQRAIET